MESTLRASMLILTSLIEERVASRLGKRTIPTILHRGEREGKQTIAVLLRSILKIILAMRIYVG